MSLSDFDDVRRPCPHCGTSILVGARKCRGCSRWLEDGGTGRRPWGRWLAFALGSLLVICAIIVTQQSHVASAPPLNPDAEAVPAAAVAVVDDAPAALNLPSPDEVVEPLVLQDRTEVAAIRWVRQQRRIDVRPLDVVFAEDGQSYFVSGGDATVREYELRTGRLLHMASVPALGDELRLLFGRYIAVVHHRQTSVVPIIDTDHWEREPLLVWVGANPSAIVELPDGETIVTASSLGRRLSAWNLSTRHRTADITLPHAVSELHLFQVDDRPYLGALGLLRQGGRTAGAWIDLFDPIERPFAATRRSVSVGRKPHGTVLPSGVGLLVADEAANTLSLLRIDEQSRPRALPVGHAPIAAHLLRKGDMAVTLDRESKTATVVDLKNFARMGTVELPGTPRHGDVSFDDKWLFVALGGDSEFPREKGVAVLGDDPLRVVAKLSTGYGAARVVASPVGYGAIVANYFDHSLTVVEGRTSGD